MATSRCSILERLPRELRDQIWKEALLCDVIDVTTTGKDSPSHQIGNSPNESDVFRTAYPPMKKRARGTSLSSKLSALLRTCSWVRHEALPIFYAHNSFQMNITEATLSRPAKWLLTLPSEGRSMIKNFTICFGAGNEDLFSKLIRQTTSFDSINMSMFVNAPRILREKNLQAISNALVGLQGVDDFKHSAIAFQFDRQAAGMWEWVSSRQCWAKLLLEMDDTFIMPERDEIGCDTCRRIGCVPRSSCQCGDALGDEALEA